MNSDLQKGYSQKTSLSELSHDAKVGRFPPGVHPPRADGVVCYAIAATTAASPGGVKDRLVGDGLVPVASALGRHKDRARALRFPADRQWVACETEHLDLVSRRDVYEQVAKHPSYWLQERT